MEIIKKTHLPFFNNGMCCKYKCFKAPLFNV